PPRPFTAGEGNDCMPRWAPDGTQLAFVSRRSSDRADRGSDIVVIPVAGGGERIRVAAWPDQVHELAWSPDGARLAFVARDPDPARYGVTGQPALKDRDIPPRRLSHLFF